MAHKLGVCVPYRNREAHMNEFVPKVSKFLDERGIDHTIYLAHQCDEHLFNRGLMKNVAAKYAFEDGCDYIVWHDIDMVPEDESCDYSYNLDNPKHLAVRISQSDYGLKYYEYFGGAVLFTKEQVEATNGYSNDYWDWGMEDDDLFWRCVREGMADRQFIEFDKTKTAAIFDGKTSMIKIPTNEDMRFALNSSHTISVLVKADQQIEKVSIWLIGDENRKFVEYPIFRKPGYDWGISFNNSRAYTAMMWNSHKEHLYQWLKRYEGEWSWVTMVVDDYNKRMHLYLNGRESNARNGTGTESPLKYEHNLKRYGSEPFYVGYTPSVAGFEPNAYFKGEIADIKFWNRALSDGEVELLHKQFSTKGLMLHYNFKEFDETGRVIDQAELNDGICKNVTFEDRDIKISDVILPYRRDGKFLCLPHQTEGLINIGGIDKWAKGETTAANERRYVLEMQQGKIDYKKDGMSNLDGRFKYLSTTPIFDKHKMINVHCIK
jgi:hypothetical protein